MEGNSRRAGLLALVTIALAGGGIALTLAHAGGPLGLLLLAVAPAAAVLGWLALGAPVHRQDVHAR